MTLVLLAADLGNGTGICSSSSKSNRFTSFTLTGAAFGVEGTGLVRCDVEELDRCGGAVVVDLESVS
jgi:hypothetical protein